MSPERWRAVRKLLEAVLDQPLSEREAFLDEQHADDGVREEVERLLALEDQADGFLDTPIFDLHHRAETRRPPQIGDRIGRYRIVSEVGRGGAGAVFLSERADQEFEQRVAIKVLRRGVDTDDVIARFRAERQILARLEHSNISRLIDGGSTEDGLPYLVMEHVEGVPIDRFCNAHDLSVRQRVELVLPLCSAIQFAHQNLVIHRDIKPTNVLVTAAGVPKLLDFGIAKLLDPEGEPSDHTRFGARGFTPEYAAPEQVAGLPVTTATDVHGIGALLYRILTGHPPYGAHRSVRRPDGQLEEAPVRRPSTVIDSAEEAPAADPSQPRRRNRRELRRKLAGDLDNILAKALATAPERRYASAADLAADLTRHLDGRPVQARGDSWFYRAGRFLRRHRVAATVSAVLLASLIAFTVHEVNLRQQASRAEARAKAITEFLVGTLEKADPERAGGHDVTLPQVLGDAEAKIEHDSSLDPETRAELLDVMGRSQLGLGAYGRARPLLEEALEIRRQIYGPNHLQVSESNYRLFRLHFDQKNDALAEAYVRKVLEIRRRRGETDHVNYATALAGLAKVKQRQGELDEAEALLTRVLEIRRRLRGADHPDVGTTLRNLATLKLEMQQPGEAASLLRQASALRPVDPAEPTPNAARTLNNVAATFEAQGDLESAERYYRQALAMQREIYEEGHRSLAVTLNNLGFLLFRRGFVAEAESSLREALTMQSELLEPTHFDRGIVLRNLADLLVSQGDAGALGLAEEAVEIFRRQSGADHWRTADARNVLGGALRIAGRLEEAEEQLLAGYQQLRGAPAAKPVNRRQAADRLVRFYEATGQSELASPYRSEAPVPPAAADTGPNDEKAGPP